MGLSLGRATVFICCVMFLSGCFFAPDMNLQLKDQPLLRSSDINQVKVNLYPLDQHIAQYPQIYGTMPADYIIESRDVVSISVWGHPEFISEHSGVNNFSVSQRATATAIVMDSYGLKTLNTDTVDKFVVNSSGNIHILYAGDVHIAGLSVDQARKKVADSLKDYIANSDVKLTMVGYRSKSVYVVGEVQQNQTLPITDVPLNLTAALQLAGWVNSTTANVNQIYVLRLNRKNGEVNAFWLDAGSVTAMLFAQSFYLQNNDIVYVSTAGLSQFNRVMTQLLPTAQTFWYTKYTMPSTALPGLLN